MLCTVNPTLSVDDVAMILACLAEVNLTDLRQPQRGLQRRLCRQLRRKVPEHYAALVAAGTFEDMANDPDTRAA